MNLIFSNFPENVSVVRSPRKQGELTKDEQKDE